MPRDEVVVLLREAEADRELRGVLARLGFEVKKNG